MATLADVVITLKEGQVNDLQMSKDLLILGDAQLKVLDSIAIAVQQNAFATIKLYDKIFKISEEQLKAQLENLEFQKEKDDRDRLEKQKGDEKTARPMLERERDGGSGVGGTEAGSLWSKLAFLIGGGLATLLASEAWLEARGMVDSAFSELTDRIKQIGAAMTLSFAVVRGAVAGLFAGGRAIRALGGLSSAVSRMFKGVGTVAGAFGKIAGPLLGIVGKLGGVLRIIPGIGQVIMVFTGIFEGIKAGFETLRDGGSIFDAILNGIGGAFAGVVNSFISLAEFIPGLKGPAESLQNWITETFTNLDDIFRNMIDGIMGVIEWAQNKWNQLTDAFTESEAEAEKNEAEAAFRTAQRRASQRSMRRLSEEEKAQRLEELESARERLRSAERAVLEEDNKLPREGRSRRTSAEGLQEQQGRIDSLPGGPIVPVTQSIVYQDNSSNVAAASINQNGQSASGFSPSNPALGAT